MNEFELIDLFVAAFRPESAPFGPGDDCAVIRPLNQLGCVTTDAVVDGVHFSLDTFSLEDVGHKALAVNLSDLAAMGATAQWMLVSLQLPPHFSATDVRQLARGMAPLASVHGVRLVGGNVTKSKTLSILLTVSGVIRKGHRPLLRSGALASDTLYVSGHLGAAAYGLKLLSGKATNQKSPRAADRLAAAAQRRPTPHLALGEFLLPFASACIDVSDGLLQDVAHLGVASGVGVHIESAAIPRFAVPNTFGSARDRVHLALSGGEDYVLAFSVPLRRRRQFERALAGQPFFVQAIGEMKSGEGVWVDGVRISSGLGHQHF